MAQRWRSVVENARGRQVRALSRLHVAAHARKQAPPPPPRTSGPELEGFDMRDGVSGTFLRRFRNEILQQEQLMDTTSDIKRSTILPHTSDRLCTYVDLYRGQRDSEGRLLVGAPTVFVSHAWAYKIVDSLDAMIEYDEFHPNSYFWFDLFANNHHPSKAAKMTQDWLKTTFRDAISRIGKSRRSKFLLHSLFPHFFFLLSISFHISRNADFDCMSVGLANSDHAGVVLVGDHVRHHAVQREIPCAHATVHHQRVCRWVSQRP
eukprot:m.316447 g.316447  ORF g.316447 m.316447 type:complete len:263 (-) comp55462_c0_seq11:2253-3041(-)